MNSSVVCLGFRSVTGYGFIVLSFIPSKEEVKMEDLSPPDHNGPPSYGRAPRQSR